MANGNKVVVRRHVRCLSVEISFVSYWPYFEDWNFALALDPPLLLDHATTSLLAVRTDPQLWV
jgi:hypothetical protein